MSAEFQSVSFGKTTARLGIKISREKLELDQADHFLSGSRLKVSIKVGGKDGQGELIKGALPHLADVADSKRFVVGLNEITAGLTFSKKDVDANMLSAFAATEGELVAERIGAASPDPDPE